MKESKRRQSLSGAVLIMILTVMFILIILLAATLTTVTTANQRIFTKYEENQAYYTARSALDVFTQNMLSDANYVSGISYTHTKADGTTETVSMKQGLGLQMDLYRLKAQSGSYNVAQSDLATESSLANKVEYASWYGTDSSKVKTDASGNEYIEYEVELPQLNDGSNKYGRLSDGLKAKIKVELLERTYDIGDYDLAGADKDSFFASAGGSDKAKAVISGNRKSDTMTVKITATAKVDGVEGIAVLILKSNKPPENNSSRAITAFGGALNTNHAYIVGGVAMIGTPGADIQWRNAGGVYGTIYDEAGLEFNVTTEINLTKSECMFIAGNLGANNNIDIRGNVPAGTNKSERPFIYVGGSVIAPNFQSVGGSDEKEKVDMVVHGINWTGNNFVVNGDIYSEGDCTFDSTAATPNITGDLYVKGNLKVGGNVAYIDGDSGLLTLNFGACNINLSGDVIYNGVAYPLTSVASNGGTITQYSFNSSNMSIPGTNDVTDVSTGEKSVEVTLPNSVKKKIDTHKTNYDDYYNMDGGNYVDDDGNPSATPVRKTAITMAGVDFTQDSFLPADFLNAENGATVSIDTAGGTARYTLKGGQNFNGSKVIISGGGTVELVLKKDQWSWDGNYNSGNGQLDIIVDDDTTLKVYGGEADKKYTFNKLSIWTQTTYDAYKNGTTLYAGSQGDNIKVPKIYYYFSGGEVALDNSSSFLTGYFFGPTTKLTANAGSNISFSDLKYNDASVNPSWRYTIIGSVLCDDFELQNDHGIIYINPSLGSAGNAADPIHSWQSSMYVRN